VTSGQCNFKPPNGRRSISRMAAFMRAV
jgi:hypothetical protein